MVKFPPGYYKATVSSSSCTWHSLFRKSCKATTLVKNKRRDFTQLSAHGGSLAVTGKPAILFWMW